jgi:hypothetical protein
MYSLLGNGLLEFINSSKSKELNKRLFIQECRYNLSLLNITDWEGSSREFKIYIIKQLKTEIAVIMLCNYKNEIISLAEIEIRKIFVKDGKGDEPNSNNLFTQIVNKINLLKVIANIPDNLKEFDKSNIDIRISNLNKALITIIKLLEA